MAIVVGYPHIVKTADKPAHLEQHPRTRVAMIVTDYVGRGWTAEEIVLHYPYLTQAEVHAALGYYHDNREEIEREMTDERQTAQRDRDESPQTDLLNRLRTQKARN